MPSRYGRAMTPGFDDPVFLTTGPSYEDGETIERDDLPDDAFRTAFTTTAEVGGNEADQIEVWAIERPDGIDDPVS